MNKPKDDNTRAERIKHDMADLKERMTRLIEESRAKAREERAEFRINAKSDRKQ